VAKREANTIRKHCTVKKKKVSTFTTRRRGKTASLQGTCRRTASRTEKGRHLPCFIRRTRCGRRRREGTKKERDPLTKGAPNAEKSYRTVKHSQSFREVRFINGALNHEVGIPPKTVRLGDQQTEGNTRIFEMFLLIENGSLSQKDVDVHEKRKGGKELLHFEKALFRGLKSFLLTEENHDTHRRS